MFNNIFSKKIDVSISFLDVISKLQNNDIPFYITGSLAMSYYVKGYISLVIPERDDIDIVVSTKSTLILEKIFQKKFMQKANSDGTKITSLDLNTKIDISMFNDFLVGGCKLDFSSNRDIFTETNKVEFGEVTFNIANTKLLLVLKLALFRGNSVTVSCDKKDIFNFKKYGLLDGQINRELIKVIPKLVSDQATVNRVLKILIERYESILSPVNTKTV